MGPGALQNNAVHGATPQFRLPHSHLSGIRLAVRIVVVRRVRGSRLAPAAIVHSRFRVACASKRGRI